MAYKTQTFKDKQVLSHNDMNNIIAGIDENKAKIASLESNSTNTPATGETLSLYEQAKHLVSRFQHQYAIQAEPYGDKDVDLILFSGQSNSCGRAQLSDCKYPEDLMLSVPLSKAFHFNNTSASTEQAIVEPITANGTSTYGYISAFLNAYYETTHHRVCACFYSVGGASLNKFVPYKLDDDSKPTSTPNTYYTTTVQRVNYAKEKLTSLGYTIKGIYLVWCQGENDAYYYGYSNNYATLKEQSLTTPELKTTYYKELFTTYLEALKTDINLEKVFFITIGHRKESPTKWEMYGPIVQAQKELGREREDCIVATTLFTGAEKFIEEDGSIRNIMRDNTHYKPEGYLRAGLDAGVNAGIYINSNKKIKPIILDYETMLFDRSSDLERSVDKFIYNPCSVDMKLMKKFASDIVTSISLNFNSITLGVNDTAQIIPTLYPSTVSNKNVTYTSTNPSVVEVSSTGLLTAKSTGETTITVTPESAHTSTATINVKVLEQVIPVSSIQLNITTADMLVGDTIQLVATILPENATDKTISWSSSDSGAASVTQEGLVTALEQGDATITATPNGNPNISATCVIQLAHKVVTLKDEVNLDFSTNTIETYEAQGIISIPSTSSRDGLTYTSKGVTTTTGSDLINGLKLAQPFSVEQDWVLEVTLTIDPWDDTKGVTEALYPNFIFCSAEPNHDTHGSNCLAPAVYINSGGFSARLGENQGNTINQSNTFTADGLEHTYKWEYNHSTNKSVLYKDGSKLDEKDWAVSYKPSGQFGYLLGAHNGYSSAKNFAIKKGYHIKSIKLSKAE